MTRIALVLFLLSIAVVVNSCGSSAEQNKKDTTSEGNISTTFSTDTAILSKLIDLSIYKPTKVKFKYTFVDNSGSNERLAVPGPSDSYLEALLYFNDSTYRRSDHLRYPTDYRDWIHGYNSPLSKPAEFNFEWLDADVKAELLTSDTSYHGNFDVLFATTKGTLWLLDDKVLLKKSTN